MLHAVGLLPAEPENPGLAVQLTCAVLAMGLLVFVGQPVHEAEPALDFHEPALHA